MTEGRIMKALSGFYYVESDGQLFACKGRGVFRNRKINPLVGDFVVFDITENGEGYIIEIKPRKNEVERPPISNVTQAVVVTSAVEPNFSTLLLDRFLVLLESKNIKPVIVITKMDLANDSMKAKMEIFKVNYEELGYSTLFHNLHSQHEINGVLHHVEDEVTVLVGQSGVGKSTLLNKMSPGLGLDTKEISQSLGRGKHTTRHVELMKVNGGLVADTPGFSSLDFTDVDAGQLATCFIEMEKYSQNCKFRSCLHDKEPHCDVKKAVNDGDVLSFRYEHYIAFLQEILSRKPRY